MRNATELLDAWKLDSAELVFGEIYGRYEGDVGEIGARVRRDVGEIRGDMREM